MFYIYKNKITCHASVSLKQRDKSFWFNLPMSHKKPNDSFIEIKDTHPKAPKGKRAYIRKYVRKDKRGVRGHPYKEYRLIKDDEIKIKSYLKQKYKKR